MTLRPYRQLTTNDSISTNFTDEQSYHDVLTLQDQSLGKTDGPQNKYEPQNWQPH